MQINEIIMWIMAAGAVLGGADLLLGNRFGFGEGFREAFRLMGPIALSMAGIICLAPLLSQALGGVIIPVFRMLGTDPGVFGSILAIDMGGYQLAMELAADPRIGAFSGIVVAAIFGCTIVFTVPVGMGTMNREDYPYFTKGIMLGLVCMPVAILVGGMLCGLSALEILRNFWPIFLFAFLTVIGLVKFPNILAKGFRWLAEIIQILATIGLVLGAVQYMTGVVMLKKLAPLEDALQIVASISVVMLGSLPLAELLKKVFKKPFAWIGSRTGLNTASTTGLLIGMVGVVPALVMFPQMDRRGQVVNAAFLVSAASAFAAHLGFAAGTQPDLVVALLAAKLVGGLLGICLGLLVTGSKKETPNYAKKI